MTYAQKGLLVGLCIGVAGLALATNSATSSAQTVPQPAPAMKLKDVPALRGVPSLTVRSATSTNHAAHVFPTVPLLNTIKRAKSAAGYQDVGPLVYHSGGSVMTGNLRFYLIFWIPAHLQNGGATSLPPGYRGVMTSLARNYGGHAISAINTQYYQTIAGTTTYITGNAILGGTVVDTGAYPTRTCNDTATPGNCLTDAQIQAKIASVMDAQGWTGGMNKMFLLFTSSGMGSCFDNSNSACSYTYYCAYHSYFTHNARPVIYGNEPYGNTSVCLGSNGVPNNGVSDAAATAASHEMSEAITDPLLDAWSSSQGNENGDLCAYNYGTNTYDGGKANQSWAGHFFDLQQEFSNHAYATTGSGCIQGGP